MDLNTVTRQDATQPTEPKEKTRSPDLVSRQHLPLRDWSNFFPAAEPVQPPLGRMLGEAKRPCSACKLPIPVSIQTCPSCGLVERPERGLPYPSKDVERYRWALDQHVGNATAKALLVALVDYDRPNGKGIFPSQARLAGDLDLRERAVRTGLAFLEARGWITRTREWLGSGAGVHHYHVHLPADATSARQDSLPVEAAVPTGRSCR